MIHRAATRRGPQHHLIQQRRKLLKRLKHSDKVDSPATPRWIGSSLSAFPCPMASRGPLLSKHKNLTARTLSNRHHRISVQHQPTCRRKSLNGTRRRNSWSHGRNNPHSISRTQRLISGSLTTAFLINMGRSMALRLSTRATSRVLCFRQTLGLSPS
jgi:hypothetical protein